MNLDIKQKQLIEAVERIAMQEGRKLKDQKLRRMYQNCFVSTAKTTTKFLENGEVFIFTGDIPALWLRDSSAQVVHYLRYLREEPVLQELVKGLIARQAFYINLDPYANAYNETDNGKCWEHDHTDTNDWEWERKYEIDSLCYPVWLVHKYVEATGDRSIFTEELQKAFQRILNTWKLEQHHADSGYYFERFYCPEIDTLPSGGRGTPVADTGMTWSGFRPSDDACRYGYLIPSNMFAVVVLHYMEHYLREQYQNDVDADLAKTLSQQIQEGIEKYATVEHPVFGKIYAYETDGMDHYNLMDDANVPSLLSLPWLGYCKKEDTIYQNTRRFILSKENPYYYQGTAAKGVGSPHTPEQYIWHIGLTMQGLTSDNRQEKDEILHYLVTTDNDCEVMHEGFDCNDPGKFTREWFAWANSLFALYITENYIYESR